MKILMIAPQPFFTPRGTPFSVLYRLHALSKLGHKVDLLTYHLGEDIIIQNVSIKRIPKIPFIKSVSVGPSKVKLLLDVFIILKSLKLLIKSRYDLIHSHEEAGFFSIWLSKIFNVKHLYDMHSSLPQQLNNFRFTKSRLLLNCFEKFEHQTLKNADGVITICSALYNRVEKQFPEKNQVLIENVVDHSWVLEKSNETIADISNRYGLKDSFKILYTGTFETYQGIDLLIESAKRVIEHHKNVQFVLVGGNSIQVHRYKQKVKEIGLSRYFVFTGQVRPNTITLFVKLADILVSPRIKGDNTPLKIYSYLRSGKPVVATNHPTHTQVLDDTVALLTKCRPEAFADGINKLINNTKLRQKLSTNALKLAETKYSFEAYLSKTKAIYDTLDGNR